MLFKGAENEEPVKEDEIKFSLIYWVKSMKKEYKEKLERYD